MRVSIVSKVKVTQVDTYEIRKIPANFGGVFKYAHTHTHTRARDNLYQQLEWRYGPKDSYVQVSPTGETDSGTSTGEAD